MKEQTTVERRGPASPPGDRSLLWLLRIGTALGFAGYAWQHLYWDAPYGVLLWKPWFYDLLSRLGMDWDGFVGDGQSEGPVRQVVLAVGWIHALLAVVALTARRRSYGQLAALTAGSVLLGVYAWCKYVQALRVPAMWIEHGGQVLMPVLLVLALRRGPRSRLVRWTAVLAFIMTFGGHGVYATGWAPVPGHFRGMVMVILGVEAETATEILKLAGVMDFVVICAILVPTLRWPAALYATVWGLLTALARPVAGMKTSLIWWGADQFVHEAVLRASHVVIPLFLCLLWWPGRGGETHDGPGGESDDCGPGHDSRKPLPSSGGGGSNPKTSEASGMETRGA